MSESPAEIAKKVGHLAASRTARNASVLFGGNFGAAALGLATVVLVSRSMSPADYGVVSIFNAIISALVGLSDLGLGTTAVKMISSRLAVNKRSAQVAMQVIFRLEILSGALIGVIGILAAPLIADLLGGQHLLTAVRLGFAASIFASAGAFIGPFMISHEKFYRNAMVSLVAPAFRALGVFALLTFSAINLENVLWVYTSVPIFAFFIGWAFSPRIGKVTPAKGETRGTLFEIVNFSKWLLVSYAANVIAGKLDILLLSRFHGPEAVGLYSAAQQLATVLPMLIGAITTIMLPKVSRMKTTAEFRGYVKKIIAGCGLVFVGLLPVLAFGSLIISVIFGDRYAGSLGAFTILFACYLLSLFANPISIILYAVNKPQVLTVINIIQLVLTLVFNVLLIPVYGMTGAAIAFAISNTFGALASIACALAYAGIGPVKIQAKK